MISVVPVFEWWLPDVSEEREAPVN